MKNDLTHLAKLEKLAKAATKGNWIAVGTCVENADDKYPDIVCQDHRADSVERMRADAAYIAAVNPKVVLKLIAEIRQLRKSVL